MRKEGQPEELTRRAFLRRAAILGAGLAFSDSLLSACGPTPTEKPAAKRKEETTAIPQVEAPQVTEKAKSTEIVKKVDVTPVTQLNKVAFPVVQKDEKRIEVLKPIPKEIVTYRSVPLVDQNFFKSVFAGVGGEEEKISGTLKDYLEYASLVFRRKIDLKDLTEDSLVALQCWSAMVQRMGIEGVTPDFSQVFSKLGEFKGIRITLNHLSPGDGGKLQIVINGSTPSEAIFRKKTHFTLWGVFTDKSGTFALGFFDEGFKREGKGESEVLYQYPVIIPLDSTEGSLKSLFEANGFSFETEKNEQGNIVLKLKRDEETFNLIPSRPDKELFDLFKKKFGALWVDQIGGKLSKNPVVPYLPEALEKKVGENYVVVKVVDKIGERVIAKIGDKEVAEFNIEKGEWKEKVEPTPAPKPEVAKEEIEGLKAVWNQEKKRWEYFDPGDNLLVGFWNDKEKKIELDANLQVLRAEWKGLFVPWTAQQADSAFIKAWNHGKGKPEVAIGSEISKGAIEKKRILKELLAFRDFSAGTMFRAPLSGKIEKFAFTDAKGIALINEGFELQIIFPSFEDYIGPDRGDVKAGTPLFRFSEKTFSPTFDRRFKGYQIVLTELINEKGINFNFTNLLRDGKGRFVYIK